MRIRELMGPRDLLNCILGALAITLVVCGIPYLAAGGPMPSLSMAATVQTHKPVIAHQMQSYQAPKPIIAATIPAWPKAYQVIPGESLSTIAKSVYHNASDWPVIYWANKQEIHYPNIINAGQNLTLPALPTRIPAPPAVLAPAPPRPLATVDAVTIQAHAPQKAAEQAAPVHAARVPSTGYAVSSAFQACVIRAESGGNAQIWNATGHYGLYQFSYSTWVAHGGAAADFGHAGAAEQTQVFWATVSADGTSDWAPYDGC